MEINPNAAVAHQNLGVALTKLGRFEEAVAHYRKSLELKPDYAVAHRNLGSVLANQGRVEEAIVELRKAIAINPDDAAGHCRLGNALVLSGRLDLAMEHYQAALDIDPYDAEAHFASGNAMARQGRLNEAMGHFQAVLDMQPDNAEAHCQLGNALACSGRLNEAAAHFQTALKIRPANAAAHDGLALVLAAQGRYEQALAHYCGALELQPGNAEAQRNLAWLRATCPERAIRNGTEAIQLAEQANRSSGGKRPDMLEALAAAYAEAQSRTRGGGICSANSWQRTRVPSTRLSRIRPFLAAFQRPPTMGSPAKWTTASKDTGAVRFSAAGKNSSVPLSGCRRRGTTRLPSATSRRTKAEPTSPDEPVIPIVIPTDASGHMTELPSL